MKAFPIFLLLILLFPFNDLSAQSRKRIDSVSYLQKVIDSLTSEKTSTTSLDTLCHNIGSHYLQLGMDSIAARYLLRVGYDNQRKFNELGTAYSRIKRREDSSFLFFRKAADANVVNNGRKNIEFAITSKNLGDQFVSRRNIDSALVYYQQAIIHRVDNFDEEDFRLNPYDLDGKEVSAPVFDVLSLKAKTLVRRYNDDGKVNDLVAAVNAYRTLYRLAPESSDSLGFEPVDVSVKLFELTGDDVFLRHAFSFAAKTEDVKKLQSDIPGDNAIIAYSVGDTSLIGLFLSKNEILSSRSGVDSTVKWKNLSKKNLYERFIFPFEKDLSAKNKLFILSDEKLSPIKFENLFDDSHVVSYALNQAFQKEKTYSFLIWIMVAIVVVLAVVVIKKIR